MLFLSTPAGIEEFVYALSEPARWPWLQPPSDGPRVPPEQLEAIEREHRVVRLGPSPADPGSRPQASLSPTTSAAQSLGADS